MTKKVSQGPQALHVNSFFPNVELSLGATPPPHMTRPQFTVTESNICSCVTTKCFGFQWYKLHLCCLLAVYVCSAGITAFKMTFQKNAPALDLTDRIFCDMGNYLFKNIFFLISVLHTKSLFSLSFPLHVQSKKKNRH